MLSRMERIRIPAAPLRAPQLPLLGLPALLFLGALLELQAAL